MVNANGKFWGAMLLEEATDLSYDRLQNEWMNVITNVPFKTDYVMIKMLFAINSYLSFLNNCTKTKPVCFWTKVLPLNTENLLQI
jgi:hypothetical protein